MSRDSSLLSILPERAWVTRQLVPHEDLSATPAVNPPRHVPEGLANQLRAIFGSRFEVLQPVAIGGMATIFQMRHRLHGGLFAVKVLHAELAKRPGVVESFRQEAEHAALLGGHPNALPVFDFGEADGLFFMLMPFVDGEDLDRILTQSGPFSRAEALQVAGQVSSVLSHAERHGIVHCDLTPGNLRLDRFGFYRLLDFGISVGPHSGAVPFTAATPLYASPERIQGQPPTARGDLYALGAILVEVLTGTPAFHAETLDAIYRRHLGGQWDPPAALAADDPLLWLLRRLLAVNPADRPESAFEVCGMLDAAGYARPEFRRLPLPEAPAARPRRRLS